jgi:hypothetical protein
VLEAVRAKEKLSQLDGAVVLIGVTARDQRDYHFTPYANFSSHWLPAQPSGSMTGAEIHAHLLAMLIDRAYVHTPLGLATLPWLLVLGGVLGYILSRVSLWLGFVTALVHQLAWLGTALAAFSWFHWHVEMTPMLLLGFFVYAVTFASHWRTPRQRIGVVEPEARAGFDVFISYRQKTGAEAARVIRERLLQQKFRVFLDVDSLKSGRFDDKLLTTIEDTPHFIVILSEKSLDHCHDPNDWLRREVSHAIQKRRNIVPVLMPDFRMPKPEELPEELRPLTTYSGIPFDHPYFDAFIDRLLKFVGQPHG